MATASLSKIKLAEALSWNTLAKVCRLCLRNECIKFDIFEDQDETLSLLQRISLFYNIKVTRSEKLPTSICSDCLLQIEIHTEYRQCVLLNEQRLRDFAVELFPKDEDEGGAREPEGPFTEQELRAATVIDPNQVYVSSSEEEEEEDDDDDDGREEGELTVDNGPILLSDDEDDDDDEEEEEGEIKQQPSPPANLHRNNSNPAAQQQLLPHHHLPKMTSILEQHLLHGLSGAGGLATHPPSHPSDPEHDQKTFFLCQYCDLGFKFQENCNEHEQTKHDATLPYNCIFCLFCCDQRSTLQQHLRDMHGFPKPFLCTECKRGFTRRSDLRKHTIVHTGVRPYTCPMCTKSFSRNTNLTKHMRIHSGHKPFVCQRCPRTFSTASDLERHSRTHDGVKPFRCSVCPSTFARRDKLINHQNMHIRRGHYDGTGVGFLSLDQQQLQQLTPPAPPSQLPPPPTAPSLMHELNSREGHPLNDSFGSHSGGGGASNSSNHQNTNSSSSAAAGSDNGAGMVIDLDEMRSANGMDMSQRILEAALMRGSLAVSALTTPNHFGSLLNLPEQLFAPSKSEQQQQQQAQGNIIPMVPTVGDSEMEEAAIPLSPLPPAPMESEPSIAAPPPQQQPSQHLPPQLPNIAAQVIAMGSNISRPFVCPVCGKGFPRKGELERHESVHSGVRPYACTMCEKRFSRKDKLVRHKRTHMMMPATGGHDAMVNGGQQQMVGHSQQQQHQQPMLPQISFTAALENFRRTEQMMSSSRTTAMQQVNMGSGRGMGGGVSQPSVGHMSGGGGGRRSGGGGGGGLGMEMGMPSNLLMSLMEPKDFTFKPNFYSQINIGGAGGDGAERESAGAVGQGTITDTTASATSIKEEF